MTTKTTPHHWNDLLNEALGCNTLQSLTQWERNFITYLYQQRKLYPDWEPNSVQNTKLEEIHEKVFP